MRLSDRFGVAAFDAGAFAGWSMAAAALMATAALSYRAYCRARARRGDSGNGGGGGRNRAAAGGGDSSGGDGPDGRAAG